MAVARGAGFWTSEHESCDDLVTKVIIEPSPAIDYRGGGLHNWFFALWHSVFSITDMKYPSTTVEGGVGYSPSFMGRRDLLSPRLRSMSPITRERGCRSTYMPP